MKNVMKAGLLLLCWIATVPFVNAAEVGVSDTEILLGSQQDLSGHGASWGIQGKEGMQMKIDEINAAGGIHGRKLKLIVEDHGLDPKKAVMLTNKMINKDKVFCFVYNMGSSTGMATLPIISKKKIPFVFPLSAHRGFYDPYNRYSFQESPPYDIQAGVAIEYICSTLGAKKVGLLFQDDEFGALVKEGTDMRLKKFGLKLAAAESFKPGATDFSSQIAKLKKADCDFIVLGTVIRETVGALKETNKIGWDVPMIGMASAMTKYVPYLAMNAGFSADGLYVVGHTPYIYPDSKVEGVSEWYQRYKEKFEKDPDMPVAHGYEAMSWLAVALEKAGRDLTREKLIDALESFNGVAGSMGSQALTFTSKSHLGADKAFIAQIQKGKFIQLTDFMK